MSQTVTWTCDRCGHAESFTYGVVIHDDFRPAAFRDHRTVPIVNGPARWAEFADDTSLEDVCPDCLTDDENVDELLSDIELDHMLNEARGADS